MIAARVHIKKLRWPIVFQETLQNYFYIWETWLSQIFKNPL